MSSAPKRGKAASKLIDGRIRELGDWRGKTLEKVRRLIKEADPEVVEEWKWMGTPVWSHSGDAGWALSSGFSAHSGSPVGEGRPATLLGWVSAWIGATGLPAGSFGGDSHGG